MADEEVLIKIGTKEDSSGAKKAQQDIKALGDETEKTGEKAKQASFDFKEFAKNAGLGATAILGTMAAAVGYGAKVAGDLESAQQGFVALLGSSEKAGEVMNRIKKEAAATPFELQGLVNGTQALTAITKDGNKAVDILMNVGKAVATSGKGSAELDRVILNLQQIAATGKVTAMDIRQFQGAIPIFNDILDAAGITTEELQNSEDAAGMLFAAFDLAGRQGGITAEGFSAQAGTFNQLVSNLHDSITIAASDIVKNSGVFDLLKTVIGSVTDAISQLTPKITQFVEYIKGNQTAMIIIAGILGGLLLAAVVGLVTAMAPLILAALAFAAAGAAIAAAISFLLPYFPMIWEAVRPVFEMITNTISEFITKHIPAFQAFWDVIKGIFSFALGFIEGFIKTTWQGIAQFFKGIWEMISGIFQVALGLITVIFGVFQGIFTGDWNKAWNTIKLGFEDIWNGIKRFFKGILDALIGELKTFVNFFIGIVNGVIGGINKVADNIPGVEGQVIPLIPHLAGGVDNFVGGIALVGEQGPELVSLPRGSSVTPAAETRQILENRSMTVNNYIYNNIDLEMMLRNLAFAVQE